MCRALSDEWTINAGREAWTDVVFIPGREVRRIPAGWQHPTNSGKYIPLLPREMPTDEGPAEIAAYETVSEGTPISPAFPGTAEGRLALVRYCSEHCFVFGDKKAGMEAWAAVLFGQGAVVTADGLCSPPDFTGQRRPTRAPTAALMPSPPACP